MKKVIITMLIAVMTFGLIACGSDNTSGSTANTTQTDTKEKTTEAATHVDSNIETATDNKIGDKTGSINNVEQTSAKASDKTLVVYFSCTGNTKNIAQSIANGLNADIYEIQAEQPYSSADLNYNDKNSRSTKEMNDKNSRPAIAGTVADWADYSTVYIGFPIWWGEAPRILDTFVESYDFTDKTVIPFCTSSSSGIGSSAKNLANLAKNGTWKDGKRFSGNESQSEVMNWVG